MPGRRLTQTPTTGSLQFACCSKRPLCASNCRWIIYQNFGLTNFAARASVRCSIRLRSLRSLNTHHESWSDIVAICFASPHFLDLNTDFSAKRRTTWWNGKVTSIRVCTSRSTVFTATIASRRQKCWKASMFCWSIFRMSARVTTLLFGRCISPCVLARDAASQSLCWIGQTQSMA